MDASTFPHQPIGLGLDQLVDLQKHRVDAERGWSLEHAFSYDNPGVVMTIGTLVLTFVLELVSFDQVLKICSGKEKRELYAKGVLMNLVNNGVIGPMLYELVATRWVSPPMATGPRMAMVSAILLAHALGYYLAHRWMHTRSMYWAHRFHHRFNSVVVPVTANAVSIAEYAIAYMAPFVAGAALLQPNLNP